MAGCIFCEIVAGRQPASIVHRDDICSAFMDIQPVNPGHVLVVPNAHASALADLDPAVGAHLFRVAQRVAAAVRVSGVRCQGVNLFLADGAAAGQDVFHVHLHVIPRYRDDGFGFRFGPAYGRRPARGDLDQLATQIREAL
ncbi:MAG: HIT family protein [Anaerolineae bacterium]|nr:HIT family protein [Anaerolineae bacterium]